jgi:hypothetical protein
VPSTAYTVCLDNCVILLISAMLRPTHLGYRSPYLWHSPISFDFRGVPDHTGALIDETISARL